MSIDREMDPRGLIPADAQQEELFAALVPSFSCWVIARFDDGALREQFGGRRWIDDATKVVRLAPPDGGLAYECEPGGRGEQLPEAMTTVHTSLTNDIRIAHLHGFALLIAPDRTALVDSTGVELAHLGFDCHWHLVNIPMGGDFYLLYDAITAIKLRLMQQTSEYQPPGQSPTQTRSTTHGH